MLVTERQGTVYVFPATSRDPIWQEYYQPLVGWGAHEPGLVVAHALCFFAFRPSSQGALPPGFEGLFVFVVRVFRERHDLFFC